MLVFSQTGSWFHSRGETWIFLPEQAASVGWYGTMRSFRLYGTGLLMTLYVIRRILNFIPNLTGSQQAEAEPLFSPVRTLAAVFWIS